MRRVSRKLHTSMSPSFYQNSGFLVFVFDLITNLLAFVSFSFQFFIHRLERESGIYFDMKYFEDMLLAGKWDDAERYLSGFTRVDDNRHSTKVYFEIRKQKFLEALDM